MSSITLDNNKIISLNNDEETVLLDCTDLISNKSRVPLHPADEHDTFFLPSILNELFKKYCSFFPEESAPVDGFDYFLIDILLSAKLVKTALPVRVAELGCTNGKLSFHLASLIAKFNETSTLCSVCDSIGNESNNQWLDMISLAESLPKLSLLAADYHDTNLCSNHFDIVIINGSVPIGDASLVIKEALRILNTNGTLICYAKEQTNLTHRMNHVFSTVEEYQASNNTIITVASKTNSFEECDETREWKSKVQRDLLLAEVALLQETGKTELFQLAERLNQHADFATANAFLDIKLKSLKLKELLLMKYVEIE